MLLTLLSYGLQAKTLCGLGVAVLDPGVHKDHLGTSTQSADTAALIATAADQLSNNLQVVHTSEHSVICQSQLKLPI